MPYIYRVENKNGDGAYRGYAPICATLNNRHSDRIGDYPLPDYDKGIERGMKRDEIAGFSTKKQALKWFTKDELYALALDGFYLKLVKVSKVTAWGEKQVLAIREEN
jgi:hypothetical protein